nr:hypothetical protein [Nitrosomonas nitrosa]
MQQSARMDACWHSSALNLGHRRAGAEPELVASIQPNSNFKQSRRQRHNKPDLGRWSGKLRMASYGNPVRHLGDEPAPAPGFAEV